MYLILILSSKIEYKARYSNRYIYYADMFFASSKTCLAWEMVFDNGEGVGATINKEEMCEIGF